MTLTGVDAIRAYQTRKATAELKDSKGNVFASVEFNRLPVDELFSFMSIFEGYDENNKSFIFKPEKIQKLRKFMVSSLISANPTVTVKEAEEFIATNYTQLLEAFMDANSGGASIKEIDEIKQALA